MTDPDAYCCRKTVGNNFEANFRIGQFLEGALQNEENI
jgi:hypothetical protein